MERWVPATIVGEGERGRWQRWELAARVEAAGPVIVRARATDLAGRTQPGHPPWNRQGYGSNAVQAALITVVPER